MKKLLSKKNSFDTIEKKITPKALTKCVSNSLLMGMKVLSAYAINRLNTQMVPYFCDKTVYLQQS